jgi:hypothetical protein
MASFESVYVQMHAEGLDATVDVARTALLTLRQPATIRSMGSLPWIQVSALRDPGEDIDLKTRMMLRKTPPPEGGSSAETLAHRLSLLISADVLSLEAETTVDYCAFSRFRGGVAVRRYACCPEEPGFVTRDDGTPDQWEPSQADDIRASSRRNSLLRLSYRVSRLVALGIERSRSSQPNSADGAAAQQAVAAAGRPTS